MCSLKIQTFSLLWWLVTDVSVCCAVFIFQFPTVRWSWCHHDRFETSGNNSHSTAHRNIPEVCTLSKRLWDLSAVERAATFLAIWQRCRQLYTEPLMIFTFIFSQLCDFRLQTRCKRGQRSSVDRQLLTVVSGKHMVPTSKVTLRRFHVRWPLKTDRNFGNYQSMLPDIPE